MSEETVAKYAARNFTILPHVVYLVTLWHSIGASDGKILIRDFEAAESDVLRKNLEDQGFFVFEIKKKPFQFLFDKGLKRRKIDNRVLLIFNQEMLVLIKAGMPIMQVLDAILERHDSGAISNI